MDTMVIYFECQLRHLKMEILMLKFFSSAFVTYRLILVDLVVFCSKITSECGETKKERSGWQVYCVVTNLVKPWFPLFPHLMSVWSALEPPSSCWHSWNIQRMLCVRMCWISGEWEMDLEGIWSTNPIASSASWAPISLCHHDGWELCKRLKGHSSNHCNCYLWVGRFA